MLQEQDGLQANATPQIDEHDEPTEPMRRSNVSAFASSNEGEIVAPNAEDIPSPKLLTQPFPHQYVQQLPVTPNVSAYGSGNNNGVYPYLPPKPDMQGGKRPAGGVHVQAGPASVPEQRRKERQKFIPVTVGLCFVAIQMLLLVRFIFKLLQLSSDSSWIGAIYAVSNVFVLPFRILFLQFAVPLFGAAEVYTLLAVLIYGIISRIVVRCLKILLKIR